MLDISIVNMYYDAVKLSIEGDYLGIKEFTEKFPEEYKLLSAIHRRRSKIKKCISAMNVVSKDIYWGTLTFNDLKNKNKIRVKRQEVFKWLNEIMSYFLIVEEFGELHGRYHCHFVGVFKFNRGVDDFRNHWHSREQIRKIYSVKKVCQYIAKYLIKELPRIRCNKLLVRLVNEYKKGVYFDNLGFDCLGARPRCQKVNIVTIFDDLEEL